MNMLSRIAMRIASGDGQFLMLVIGIPGSGKSTFAKSVPNAVHYEADMYFEDGEGGYHFDMKMIGEAHRWCQRMVDNELSKGNNVVVSNTGLSRWERDAYYNIAEKHGVQIKLKVMTGDYGNIHGVPEHTIEMMKKRFQPVSQYEIQKHDIEMI